MGKLISGGPNVPTFYGIICLFDKISEFSLINLNIFILFCHFIYPLPEYVPFLTTSSLGSFDKDDGQQQQQSVQIRR